MGVIVSCGGKKKEDTTEEPDNPEPDDNALTPAQTTNDFIRPLENAYPPLPPVDDVEYGPGAAVGAIQRPKTYAVVVSRLAGHKWLKLKLEPRDKTEEEENEENPDEEVLED